jgi:hypothetical protein
MYITICAESKPAPKMIIFGLTKKKTASANTVKTAYLANDPFVECTLDFVGRSPILFFRL